jgi:hypothetical protein
MVSAKRGIRSEESVQEETHGWENVLCYLRANEWHGQDREKEEKIYYC